MSQQKQNPTEIRRSPLTDLRALASSAVVHGLLLVASSLVVLRAALPEAEDDNDALYGEIGPVDSRAEAVGAGGSPGDLGGTLTPEQMEVAAAPEDAVPVGTETEAMTDALVDDVLAPADLPTSSTDEPLPLPTVNGIGALPGAGTGGGGGTGGGSGGGLGKGIGAGTEFFDTKERAASFVYVIDRSGSMTNRGSLEIAKSELLTSLRRLPPETQFGVVFYENAPETFADSAGRKSLMSASSQNKARLQNRLAQIIADGGTNHSDALEAGIDLEPEVIFFLTDGQDLTDRQAKNLIEAAGPIRIHAIEFGVGPDTGLSVPLRTLAYRTGGSYRYIDVVTLTRQHRSEQARLNARPDQAEADQGATAPADPRARSSAPGRPDASPR